MNNFTTDITNALVLKQDLNEVLRVHLESAMNELLKAELSAYLNYEKYSREGWKISNSRNGFYDRNFHTEYGELQLKIPRDRKGEFQNQLLEPYQRRHDNLETTIVTMFQKGMSSRDIADVISKMYGHHYSPQSISNITKRVDELVDSFRKRALAPRYTCIFLDATVLPLRRDTVEKEALHIAIGIREDGTKEILSYLLAPVESSYVWEELIIDIKHRGVEEVLLFTTDGLSGLRDRILEHFPKAKYQSCLVHVQRNIRKKVRKADAQEVADDFKKTYEQDTKKLALKTFEEFKNKWEKKYPTVIKNLNNNGHLYEFMDFPQSIRKTLYTTNLIEGFNKLLKSYTKRKDQFPTEDSLERFVVSRFYDYNDKHLDRTHTGFGKALIEIEKMFDELQ
jgi:transposase-like protein